MSEKRLQEIKDSIEFQREILEAHNMNTLCVDEEQELVEEIERLHSIIKEAIEYINEMTLTSDGYANYGDDLRPEHIIDILKGKQ